MSCNKTEAMKCMKVPNYLGYQYETKESITINVATCVRILMFQIRSLPCTSALGGQTAELRGPSASHQR